MNSAFIYLGEHRQFPALTTENIPRFLSLCREFGVSSLYVQATGEIQWTLGTVSKVAALPGVFDKLESLLKHSERMHISVHVGLLQTKGADPQAAGGQWQEAIHQENIKWARDLWSKFGQYRSFQGWYLADEPGDVTDLGAIALTRRLTDSLKAIADIQVTVSPYLHGQTLAPRDLAAAAKRFMIGTGVDLQLWQDSVGVGNEAGGSRQSRDTAKFRANFYRELMASLGPRHAGSVVELFNSATPGGGENYAFGETAFYRAASSARIHEQIKANCRGFEVCSSWLIQFHFFADELDFYPKKSSWPESARLRHTFNGSGIVDVTIHWASNPDEKYPDVMPSKLLDGHAGNPDDVVGGSWVGVERSAEFEIDLADRATLNWIGVQFAHRPDFGIYLPSRMIVRCRDEGGLGLLGAFELSFKPSVDDREYVMGNGVPLNAVCRRIGVSVFGNGWIFIGEVELGR